MVNLRFADNSIVSNPGNKNHKVYSPVVRPSGKVDLVCSGVEDTDAYIQSFAESTDMSFILAKLASGDDSVLRRNKPVFGDFIKAPKSLAEMMQMQIDAKSLYDRLPAEVKSKFNNDPNQFFAAAGSEEWFSKLGFEKKNNIDMASAADQAAADKTVTKEE